MFDSYLVGPAPGRCRVAGAFYEQYKGVAVIELGYDPPSFALVLAAGATFEAALEASVPWPTGLVIDLLITGDGAPITWVATISGTRASWSRTVAQVAAVTDSTLRSVALRAIPSGGEPAVWYRGSVRVT